MFCVYRCGSHQPHIDTENFKCGLPKQLTFLFDLKLNFSVSNSHWLASTDQEKHKCLRRHCNKMMTSWGLKRVFPVNTLVFKNINPKLQRSPAQPNLPPWFWLTPPSNPSIRKSCLGTADPIMSSAFWKLHQTENLKCIPEFREDSLKRLRTVGFQLYNILENAKLWRE